MLRYLTHGGVAAGRCNTDDSRQIQHGLAGAQHTISMFNCLLYLPRTWSVFVWSSLLPAAASCAANAPRSLCCARLFVHQATASSELQKKLEKWNSRAESGAITSPGASTPATVTPSTAASAGRAAPPTEGIVARGRAAASGGTPGYVQPCERCMDANFGRHVVSILRSWLTRLRLCVWLLRCARLPLGVTLATRRYHVTALRRYVFVAGLRSQWRCRNRGRHFARWWFIP